MFDIKNKITERTYFFVISVFLLFLLVNYDPNVTQIFLFFAFFSVIAYKLDNNVTYEFEAEESNRLKNIAIGIGAVFLFYIVTGPLIQILSSIFRFPLESGFSVQSLYASNILFSNYILQGSQWVTILMWAILIPITENLFAIRLWEWLQDSFSVGESWLGAVISGLLVATIMALFHINAKGAALVASAALFTTLLFFFMILMLTKLTKDTIAGNSSHITVNGLAIKAMIPTLTISPIFVAVVGILGLVLILKTRVITYVLGEV